MLREQVLDFLCADYRFQPAAALDIDPAVRGFVELRPGPVLRCRDLYSLQGPVIRAPAYIKGILGSGRRPFLRSEIEQERRVHIFSLSIVGPDFQFGIVSGHIVRVRNLDRTGEHIDSAPLAGLWICPQIYSRHLFKVFVQVHLDVGVFHEQRYHFFRELVREVERERIPSIVNHRPLADEFIRAEHFIIKVIGV